MALMNWVCVECWNDQWMCRAMPRLECRQCGGAECWWGYPVGSQQLLSERKRVIVYE